MKTYTLEGTKHADIKRVVDREGNWERYYRESTGEYLTGVTTILNRGYAKGFFYEKWLTDHTAEEREEILKAAGEKGDKVHRAIDLLLSTVQTKVTMTKDTAVYNKTSGEEEEMSNAEWGCMLSFAAFWSAHKPIVLTSEATMFNSAHGYAGTADAIIILTQECGIDTCKCKGLAGKIGLYDWKSSSGIRASYSAQTAAYANAENIQEYLPEGATIDYTAVLRLGTPHVKTKGYEMQTWLGKDLAFAWKRFLGAKDITDYEFKPFDPQKEIQDIPEELELEVPKLDLKADFAAGLTIEKENKIPWKTSKKQ